MESINEAIEKAIHFLSILQNSCDSRRLQVEQHNLKCHATYVKEWKAEQKKLEEESRKKAQGSYNDSEKKKDVLIVEDFEELSLANTLLEKARALRSKSKSLPKQIVKLEHPTASNIELSNANSLADRISEKNLMKNCTITSYARSSSHSKVLKNSKMVRSRSLNDNMVKKVNGLTNSNPNVKGEKHEQIAYTKNGMSKNSDLEVVTGLKYNELKEISQSRSITLNNQEKKVKKPESQSIIIHSGSSQVPPHNFTLSYKLFKNNFQSSLQFKSHFQLQKDGFWYPFIKPSNKASLFKRTKCNTLESFIKILKLIHGIQEIMLWIDLLTILGKDIVPTLKLLDDEDRNVIRLCSHLSSVYHESLQRIPMLNIE